VLGRGRLALPAAGRRAH